ncbi:nucleoside 2-deoxyribosyltransferase [Methylomonas rivi]|uniref:Nucleoside 2-deoxyribosyltransferase n=1 Tax=Methylomonas rivi TaxID=2952226 RepID=A0ABT1U915_9GAMM|nr:nucleoside 2-deoxyribosyltransferase [Methylomonas sp. WSC-6]MCQ8130344.1 nucleoside 2-deoxyribosyltransferase [Methylomonas sp. WSC-6]
MNRKNIGFYAYASSPREIGQTIEEAINKITEKDDIKIKTWKALDVVGHFIADQVLEDLDACDFLVADISILNFNVTYEIGYAIGRRKRVLIFRNKSIIEKNLTIREVGIFDTLGYKEYQNSSELYSFLKKTNKCEPLNIPNKINIKSPVYLLEGLHKTDWASRIVSRIKKARYLFRSFDPNEQPRLSANDAISQVSQSHGIVVPLLSSNNIGYEVHNMRGAFIAGLADGMRKALCILQDGEDPVPIDYRDFVNVSFHPNDVNEYIADFAARVAEAFQQDSSSEFAAKDDSFLQALDLGSTSAENEMRTLERYYLKTDQFLKSLRGEANIVVGRKGSGKSAIFLQVRDRERNKKGNIVLDLKPDGYKLIKFKELILSFLEEGTFQHTIMAFWEYVLLLEICYKILEKDRENHKRDHELYELYRNLADIYHAEGYETEGDFSERMGILMEKISTEYKSKHGEKQNVRLTSSALTEMLYCHDVRELTRQIIEYMRHKEVCWLLFDNIDKGWPTSGLEHEDMLLIRALIDATKKIERQFGKSGIDVNTIIFLRNDVYELLVKETSDRGKEASVLLDWTDPDLLRELIRLRIISNEINGASTFEALWPKICTSHYKGEESSQYLIDRSLMRPRFLLNLVSQCKSFAINLNHEKILGDDIKKGLKAYSTDLLADIGYEISDVDNRTQDVLYAFIGSNATIKQSEICAVLKEFGIEDVLLEKIFELLLWYGFIGLVVDEEVKYIYNFNYSMKLMSGIVKKKGNMDYLINPAFWPALMIDEN